MKNPNESDGVSISIRADDLTALTGLTDRRLRQLATQGFYPPPNRGVYQREETLRGLFRYYREREENDTSALRKEEQGYVRAKRRMAELQLEEKLGIVVPMSCVEFIFSNTWLPFRQRLYRLPVDVSYDCEGKTRGQIQELIEDGISKLIDEHRESVFNMKKQCDQVLEEAGVKNPKNKIEDENETQTDAAE